METTKRTCSIFGCGKTSYRPFSIAPATVVDLCLKHFVAENDVVDEEDSDVAAESASDGS